MMNGPFVPDDYGLAFGRNAPRTLVVTVGTGTPLNVTGEPVNITDVSIIGRYLTAGITV